MQNTEQAAILKQGFAQAEKITKKYAKTFYFASPFLSKERRQAAYAAYAICRIADDYVDNDRSDAASQKLIVIKQDIDNAYAGSPTEEPLLRAFRNSIEKFAIPKEYFTYIIEGMYMDLNKTRYADFAQLHEYCYKVAGAVGLIMLQIFQDTTREARPYAIDLGVALQLTNIIRDIKEDFARGRIYLPQEELEKFGVTQEDIAGGNINENFKALLQFQIQRARLYYSRCLEGVSFIRERSCRFLVLAIKQMYAEILEVIERNNYDVFRQRAQVGKFRKLSILFRLLLRSK